jgi:hypothetical protein
MVTSSIMKEALPANQIRPTPQQNGEEPEQGTRKAGALKLAIVQSNYVPWKGYFDLINSVDHFILFDDMQYTRRDWRNRNKIKTALGSIWITIPVDAKGKFCQKIHETKISDPDWKVKHWRTILHNYKKAAYFKNYQELFEGLFLGSEEKFLSQINYRFLTAICELLGIRTTLSWSMEYQYGGSKTERLISLCKLVGAAEYVSGPTARGYLDEALFAEEGLKVSYMDYADYPEYAQLFPPFEHAVSIIDLILNAGPTAARYMKSF